MDITEQESYELGYLLTPFVSAEKLPETLEGVRIIIAKHDGEILSETNPRFVQLAYPIRKPIEHQRTVFKDAYFGSVVFRLAREKTEELLTDLKRQPALIRFILVKYLPITPARGRLRPVKPVSAVPARATAAAAPSALGAVPETEKREAIDREIEGLLVPPK
jgi:ribosomal protein S6